MSPLLFILVMDILNRSIMAIKESCQTIGSKISRNGEVTTFMFGDDVMCDGVTEITEWETFHKIFDKFGKASRLVINSSKPKLITNDQVSNIILATATLFGINICFMIDGFKYLGLFLKLIKYLSHGLEWLIAKLKNKLTC